MQKGDVIATCADVDALRQAIGFEPRTGLRQGVAHRVRWFKRTYGA